ncbi:hypothetical protein JNO54_06585 [Janibacter sp. YIM B02568]|uniref:hypothetical protein n=1 Tax=Janibacter endophyticus TaxID=2806261 RepID=UPI00194E7AA8|nr:hypothetical protein [Janibacter endophyticus]MBM6545805.1 hypothetical protein [Janibacter endophyticus]
MSLHCPARLILAKGEDPVSPVVASVRSERVAAVCAAPGESAVAERAATDLGCPVEEVATLAELGRWTEALVEIADLHRGESVLVIAPRGALERSITVDVGDDGIVTRGTLD